jgi:hypothetical protein
MLDEVWKKGNCRTTWDGETIAEIVPEGDAELRTGLGEAEKSIAAIAAGVAAGAAADLSLGDLAADVVLRSVGVERDLGPVVDEEQFGLVGVKSGEQAVEGDEIGAAPEDAVETGT